MYNPTELQAYGQQDQRASRTETAQNRLAGAQAQGSKRLTQMQWCECCHKNAHVKPQQKTERVDETALKLQGRTYCGVFCNYAADTLSS